jgi:hypothetical protein
MSYDHFPSVEKGSAMKRDSEPASKFISWKHLFTELLSEASVFRYIDLGLMGVYVLFWFSR